MKFVPAAKTAYESPRSRVVRINVQNLVCTSPTSTEGYTINQHILHEDDWQ